MKDVKRAASHLGILQDWIREYLERSRDQVHKDVFYWLCLLNYETAELVKMCVYRHAYQGKK